MKKSGIYQIRNLINEKRYIGQSIELNKRKMAHFNHLKNNNHDNLHLQRSYNKYNEENFVFEILLYCEEFQLTDYEQFFVDQYNGKELLYNARLECVSSNRGIKWTEAQRKNMSKAQSGENGPMWGKRHKEEAKIKISMAKITKKDIISEVLKLLDKGMRAKDIAKQIDVSIQTIYKIKNGKYNEIYDLSDKNYVDSRIKIKKDTVLKILELLDERIVQKDITKETGISISAIYKIKNGGYDEIYNLPKKNYAHGLTIKKEIVLEILKLLDKKMSVKNIEKQLGVSQTTVYRAKNGYYDDIYDLKKD